MPELLFSPSDVGIEQMGIVEALVNGISNLGDGQWDRGDASSIEVARVQAEVAEVAIARICRGRGVGDFQISADRGLSFIP